MTPRRPGRPLGSGYAPGEARDQTLTVRVRARELAAIKERASVYGLSVSVYARMCLLGDIPT